MAWPWLYMVVCFAPVEILDCQDFPHIPKNLMSRNPGKTIFLEKRIYYYQQFQGSHLLRDLGTCPTSQDFPVTFPGFLFFFFRLGDPLGRSRTEPGVFSLDGSNAVSPGEIDTSL